MSYFHSVFSKHTNTSFQPVNVSFDRVSPTFYQTELPNCGDLIMNIYLRGVKMENIKSFTLFVNDETIQSFTGEYMYINQYLRTPKQKANLLSESNYVVVPVKKYLPVFPGNKIVMELFEAASVDMVIDFMFLENPIKQTDMLIEQVQFIDEIYRGGGTTRVSLNLKRLVKELIIVVKNTNKTGLDFSNAAGLDQISNLKIEINQFTKADQSGVYFSRVQPFDYHTRVPELPSLFYTYSFCLDPESEFPTGTINMGMIKNQNLYFTFNDNEPKNIHIYAVSYNVIAYDGKLIFV